MENLIKTIREIIAQENALVMYRNQYGRMDEMYKDDSEIPYNHYYPLNQQDIPVIIMEPKDRVMAAMQRKIDFEKENLDKMKSKAVEQMQELIELWT